MGAFFYLYYLVLIGGLNMLVIDFTKTKLLTEAGILSALGAWSKTLLRHMYGKDVKMVADLTNVSNLAGMLNEEDKPNFIIRGKHRDVKAYATAIVREKDYLDAIIEFGKKHPNTAKARANLLPAVRDFESATGLRWPFKDEE